MNICECGICGLEVAKHGNRFILGHSLQGSKHIPWNKGKTKAANPELNFGGPQKGHLVSEETREKMRQKKIGVPQSAEAKNRRSIGVKKFLLEHGNERLIKNFGPVGSKKFQYISKDGIEIGMRSSWEVLYSKFLDSQGIIWQYEPKYFKLSNGKYYWPDFYLPDLNEYHEIKGFLFNNAKEKIDLFQKEYPSTKFQILFKKDLIQLGVL